jgi:hypothetical protein
MNRENAKAILQELGIDRPSDTLIENYIRANGAQEPTEPSQAEEQSSSPVSGTERSEVPPRPSSSHSNLKPLL